MSNLQRHKDCAMRSEIGNCLAIGGFCTSVSKEICEALQNAYARGKHSVEVSKDAISRADAIKAFTLNSKGERIPFVDCDNFPVEFPLRYIVDTLAALPPADKPQGEWIAKDGVFYCSRCDNDSGLSEEDVDLYEMSLPNYCKDCGAKMKG